VVLSGRALALAVLARSLLKVTLGKLFGARTGIALFRENYDADRLPPLDPAERAELSRFSRCIACGRCDIGEAERMARSRGAYPGLMAVVLASSRSMPDFDAARLALDHVPDAVLAAKENDDVCPTGVPFVSLARFVRAKAAQMHEVAPSLPPPAKALPAQGREVRA
jgi:succinate dehydrogenase/fumarate reductase-like Fe-S protein